MITKEPGVQLEPVQTLSTQWGQLSVEARRKVDSLTQTLRELDKCEQALKDHQVEVATDLGPIGNAAKAARRDLERDTGPKFELPRS